VLRVDATRIAAKLFVASSLKARVVATSWRSRASQRLSWARVVATGIGDRSAGSGTSPGNTFPEILAHHVIGLVDAVGATGDSLETLNQLDPGVQSWQLLVAPRDIQTAPFWLPL
jgi:hypothetical protein